MEEKKSFFDGMEPRSALLVGLAAGFMGLCTIGFFILGGIMLSRGGVNPTGRVVPPAVAAADQPAPAAGAPAPVPSAPTGPVSFTITKNDHVEGNFDAPVTLVEFSDFQCPYCSRFYPTTKELLKQYGNKIRIVYKHFPLSFHQFAEKAAEASECASEQGKFWEMHDKIFENQQLLSLEQLKVWAKDLKLNTAKFDSCLDSGKFAAKVQADIQEASQKGVDATPSTFVNGKLFSGALPLETFKQVIDQELKK